jgi:hypothetical protein
MQQSQVQHIALGMAAAESMRVRGQAREQRDRQSVVATPERDQRAAGGKAEQPRGLAVSRGQHSRSLDSKLEASRPIPVPCADEGQHRVKLQKSSPIVGSQASASSPQRVPVFPPSR